MESSRYLWLHFTAACNAQLSLLLYNFNTHILAPNRLECLSLAGLSSIRVGQSTFQVISSKVGSWPYQQTLDWDGKASQRQTL